MLPGSLELGLRRAREENASLAAAVNEHKVLVKIIEKKPGEKELNCMALSQEQKGPKHEVEKIECEKNYYVRRQKVRWAVLFEKVVFL